MQSIFRYPGGKTRRGIQDWILSMKPPGAKEYREPFVGGGGVFWHAGGFEQRWINDINAGLIAVYLALRDRPEEFIARCKSVPVADPREELCEPGERGGKPVNKRLKELFERVAFDEKEDPAFRYFFVNRTVFGGRVNYDIPSRLYFSNPEGWNVVQSDRLKRAAKWVSGAKITCGDYEPLFLEPGENVWIYADPPYLVNSELSRTSQLYQYNFATEDHERLADVVRRSPHKVAISYDDDEGGVIRGLYPKSDGFFHYEHEWDYVGTTNAKKEAGKELLICNYEVDFRELFNPGNAGRKPLTARQRADLERLEGQILTAHRWFVQAGKALRDIDDRELWQADFPTFADYCWVRWGYQKVYAYRLQKACQAYEAIDSKLPIGNFRPNTETQARPLTRLTSADQQVEVWKAVIGRSSEEGVPITAKLVKEEVDRELGIIPPAPKTELDRVIDLWGRLPRDIKKAFKEWINDQSV